MRAFIGLCWLTIGAALMAGCGKSAPPGKLDLKDVDGYLRRLNASQTAGSKAIRAQIAQASRDLTAQLLAAKTEGIPVDPDQLQRPIPPPALDAAPDYERLMAILRTKPLDRRAGMLAGEARLSERAPEVLAAVRRMLAKRQDVMGLIRSATDKPQCVFVRRWSLGSMVLMPEFAPMREAARLLRAESCLIAKDGRDGEAIAEQARGFRLAEQAGSDPTLISHLVGTYIDSIALAGMEDILQMAGPNAQIADLVRRTVETHRPRLSLRRALRGEVACMTVTMDMLRRSPPEAMSLLQADTMAIANMPAYGAPPRPSVRRAIEPTNTVGATPVKVDIGVTQSSEDGSFHYTINGRSFPKPFLAKLGETQIWTITNSTPWSHPVHLHGFFFLVLDKNSVPVHPLEWKDTVSVPFKETVRFIVRFDDRAGSWMFHCHILDHAEGGLMGTVQLSATGEAQPDTGIMEHVHAATP